MILAFACASWQLHSRQKAETIVRTLVGSNANIAFVVVAVRPEALGGAKVARASKVAHRPKTGPETTHVSLSRQRNTGLEMATLVAQLVPRLDHAGSILQSVVVMSRELEHKRAVLCPCSIGIVPLRSIRDYFITERLRNLPPDPA